MEGILLGMGNPLLDMSAVVDPPFLSKYDIQLNNAILAEDKHLPMHVIVFFLSKNIGLLLANSLSTAGIANIGLFLTQTNNVEEIALKISQLAKASGAHRRITVITEGSDPVVVAEDGKVRLFPVILLNKEKLVDTNGAGDLQEKPIEVCVRAGCTTQNNQIFLRSFLFRL